MLRRREVVLGSRGQDGDGHAVAGDIAEGSHVVESEGGDACVVSTRAEQGEGCVTVGLGPTSGSSTISNLDVSVLEEGEVLGKPGSDAWKAKKQDLLA